MKQILILCVIFQVSLAYSQTDHLTYIRKAYNEAKDATEITAKQTTIKYERVIPALGTCYTTVNYYGYEILDEEVTNPWTNNGMLKLQFVTVQYNISAALVMHEYLFDLTTGNILFCYEKDTYRNKEYRFYFKNKQLVKYIFNTVSAQGEKLTVTNNFSEEELMHAQKIINKSERYKKTYAEINDLEKIEKR